MLFRSSIQAALETLRQPRASGQRVLSVYLDTSPNRVSGQGYLISFEEACRNLVADLPDAERKGAQAAIAQANGYLRDRLEPRTPGLALFASGDPDYFFSVPLPRRPHEQASWDSRPHVAPLVAIIDDLERIGVVLFDKERARLYTLFLGEIEERRVVEDEVPGKQATGGWFGLAQARYARHHEDHVIRHAKHASAELMAMLRTHPFDRLLIGGPDEAITLFQHHLPKPLRARLAGFLRLELFAPDAEVVDAALRVAESIERQEEADAVNQLLEEANTRHAVVGVGPTLEALDEGRVYSLLVADGLQLLGGECAQCRCLVVAGARCPGCGQPVEGSADLRECAFERALQQDARIDEVAGEAAHRLQEYGGLGAWTRF